MIVGVPKEIKKEECRVSLLPEGVSVLTKKGHSVLVEKNAHLFAKVLEHQNAQISVAFSTQP